MRTLAILAAALLLTAAGGPPPQVRVAEPVSGNATIETCADGAVNGLITVSIAATVALFAEVALPAYPILFTIGPAVGCPVRIMGERLKVAMLP